MITNGPHNKDMGIIVKNIKLIAALIILYITNLIHALKWNDLLFHMMELNDHCDLQNQRNKRRVKL